MSAHRAGAEAWDALVDPAGARHHRSGVAGRPSRVITVIGAAGGVGASLVACGIALGLADDRERVCLINFAGDLAGAWGIPPDRTLDDLTPVLGELEPRHVEVIALRHRSNVALLLGSPTGSHMWDRPAVSRLLTCSTALGELVIDAGVGTGPGAVESVVRGRVVIVAAQTIPGARAGRSRLDLIRSLDLRDEPLLVANRGVGRDHLSVRTFVRATGHPVAVELPRAERDADALGAGLRPRRRRGSLLAAFDELIARVRRP